MRRKVNGIHGRYGCINGTHLYYEQAGSGHALVLIDGFTLNTQMWEDQFNVFAQHYRVIRYDMRGSGQSAMPQRSRLQKWTISVHF